MQQNRLGFQDSLPVRPITKSRAYKAVIIIVPQDKQTTETTAYPGSHIAIDSQVYCLSDKSGLYHVPFETR